jgi:hypothetical protein
MECGWRPILIERKGCNTSQISRIPTKEIANKLKQGDNARVLSPLSKGLEECRVRGKDRKRSNSKPIVFITAYVGCL